jgi:alkanesulfonate monooxygenase SsuD/methylene tetrahydromethanopterin reductase-like flavin-dependent oxidoreductase (luciferase family)
VEQIRLILAAPLRAHACVVIDGEVRDAQVDRSVRRDLLAEGLHDVRFTDPVARLGAVVRQVRRLLDGERLTPSLPGEHRPLRLGTSPRPDLPIHLAALGPVGVRLTGELADGWSPFLLPASALGRRIRTLEQGAVRSGRSPGSTQICPSIAVAVSPDPATAREIASWWVAFYLTSMGPLYRLRRLCSETRPQTVT